MAFLANSLIRYQARLASNGPKASQFWRLATTPRSSKVAPTNPSEAVVEASVLRAGERVRITATLVEAATDGQLWTESYERDLQDVLALQSEVAQAIAREIRIAMAPEEEARLASARVVNPAAHEAYLKGMYHLNRFAPEGFEKGFAYARIYERRCNMRS